MKYIISNNHGNIPWLSITSESPADQKVLVELEKQLIANKARFNSQGCGDRIEFISLHLQESS